MPRHPAQGEGLIISTRVAHVVGIAATAAGLLVTSPASAASTGSPAAYPTFSGRLYSVAASSASNVWAAGLTPDSSLIVHWNGTTWKQVPCPIPASGGQFYSVSATSPTDVWAIGQTGGDATADGQQNLIEHWNGTAWTRVPSPDPAGGANFLRGVAAISPGNVWAVGYTNFTSHQNAVILHWNGTTWSQVASNAGLPDAELISVAGTPGSDAWAVGITNPSTCNPQCGTLILHWNGTSWYPVPSPNPPAGYLNTLLGVVAICPHDAWAVGTTDNASTLITHWNGKVWR